MPRPPPFADLDAALAALDPKLRQRNPTCSIEKLLKDVRRLRDVVEPERARFVALQDFDLAALDQLGELERRALHADLVWREARKKPQRRQVREDAIKLRFDLVAAIRVLVRPDEALRKRLDGFHKRRKLPHIAADLADLACVVDAHAEAFAHAPCLPEQPADAARALARAVSGGTAQMAALDAKGDRNAAVVLLSMALAEVGCAARYVFRHEPEFLERLADPVARARRRKAARRSADATGESSRPPGTDQAPAAGAGGSPGVADLGSRR